MQFKRPKNDYKYEWTNHALQKMMYYGISESLIKRITRFPKRTEEGIAPNTVAVMQPTANKKKPQEVWVMYQWKGEKKRIISAWRYPGVTEPGKKLQIPEDILIDLEKYVRVTK